LAADFEGWRQSSYVVEGTEGCEGGAGGEGAVTSGKVAKMKGCLQVRDENSAKSEADDF